MKINLENLGKSLQPRVVVDKITIFLENKIKLVLFIFLAIVASYGVFIWYRYILNPKWSETRIQEYVKTKEKGTALNEENFNSVVTEKKERSDHYQEKKDNLEDIFRLK